MKITLVVLLLLLISPALQQDQPDEPPTARPVAASGRTRQTVDILDGPPKDL